MLDLLIMNKADIKKFRDVFRRFEREIFFQNNESCCKGITLSQCYTLVEIENKVAISLKDLAGQLSLDKSTVSRTVDGLVNIGLVERTVPSDNRRMTLLNLTKTGTSTCNSINSISDKFIEEHLSELNEKERNDLLRLLRKLIASMEGKRKK